MTTLRNDDNPVYETEGGNDTQDRIFLLSLEEAEDYFKDDDDRKANGSGDINDIEDLYWWLRTPGKKSSEAAYVNTDGKVIVAGVHRGADEGGVRPALWLNL